MTALHTGVEAAPATRSETAAERIYSILEAEISIGWLGPRARLIEDELIARFSAKRHVIREALARLVRAGIAVKIPNRGVSVRHFEIEEMEHIYQVREILQRETARLIPLPGPRSLVAKLRDIQSHHAAAIEANDLREILRFNAEFHDTLFASCGNPHLVEAIGKYAHLIQAIRSYRVANPELLRQARDEHVAMIDALEIGDRATLVHLCVAHILPSKRAYVAAFRHATEGAARISDTSNEG
jgi:DNA-binding GntR family transcriptional regulator